MVAPFRASHAARKLGSGRVHFTAPKLFELSLCLRGARRNDGWFFVNVTFLFTVGGDQTGMLGTLYPRFYATTMLHLSQSFPERRPPG